MIPTLSTYPPSPIQSQLGFLPTANHSVLTPPGAAPLVLKGAGFDFCGCSLRPDRLHLPLNLENLPRPPLALEILRNFGLLTFLGDGSYCLV